MSTSDQIRIDYDDDQLNVVEKINKALKARGLVLIDDGLPHDGYCLVALQAIQPSAEVKPSIKHVTEQMWLPDVREDGVYLVAAEDRTVVLKLCRPDRSSDLLIAGYIVGLQVVKLPKEEKSK